jgi:microcystin-dependent protein
MAQKRFDTATKLTVRDESLKIDASGPSPAFEFVDHTDSSVFSIDETGSIIFSELIIDSLIDIREEITSGYVSTLSGEDGISVSLSNGEATVSIGQDVSTSSNVVFSGLNVTEKLTVNGNFSSTGGINAFSTETFEIDASFIVLNSDETGSPSENAGIEIERGSENNVSIVWNESTDKWTFTNDGIVYKNIGAMSSLEDAGDTQISVSPSNESILLFNGTKWVDSSFGYSDPVGSIIMMTSATPPSLKWKICNGQAISRTTYSELWDLLRNGGSSSPYGNGDGSTTFNLPDIVSYTIFGTSSASSASASFFSENQNSQHSHTITIDPNTSFHSHSSISYGSSSNTHFHNAANFADAAPHGHNSNPSNINTEHQHNVGLSAGGATHSHPSSPVAGQQGAPHTHPYRSTPTTGATSGANPHSHTHSRAAYNTLGVTANHFHFVDFGNDNAPHSHPSTNISPTYNHNHNINDAGPSGGHSHGDSNLPSNNVSHSHNAEVTTSDSQTHTHSIDSVSIVYMIKVLP